MMKTVLPQDVKYFSEKQLLYFLATSLLFIWTWVLVAAKLDKGNDRGLLTLCGFVGITAAILSVFFAKFKWVAFIGSVFYLIISLFLIIGLTSVGFRVGDFINSNWIGFCLPLLGMALFFFLLVRRLISFPNNYHAFLTFLVIPTLVLIAAQFYPSYLDRDYLFSISCGSYLTLFFIAIGMLCRRKS